MMYHFNSTFCRKRPRTLFCSGLVLFGLWVVLGGRLGCATDSFGRTLESQPPGELLTIAESSGYRATARPEDVLAWLDQLAARSDRIRLVTIGQTVEGRPIRCAIAADPPLPDPEKRPPGDTRLVVLLLGGIHAGECDGKEALLALLRDAALAPDHPWWRDYVLLVIPDFNADGANRVGTAHRPGQNGPELGCGRRENAQELDLNRDFIKLESPEVRALVSWARRWDPDVFIDTHTTNGSRHRYLLTFDIPHNPAVPQPMTNWLREALLPAVQKRLEQQGLATEYYGNFDAERKRWTSYGLEPRYSTEYFGLCGTVSILSESYSYAPYRERIDATRRFIATLLDELRERKSQVKKLRDEWRRTTVEAGSHPAGARPITIAGRLAAWPEPIVIRAWDEQQPRDYPVEHWAMGVATTRVARPYAYLLPEESSRVADRLLMHGLTVEQLTRNVTLDVEQYVIAKREQAATPFQGHRLVRLEVTKKHVRRSVPAGTYVVRMAQPLADLAAWLLEPQSQDGLATWNFFDRSAARAGELFPVERIAEPVRLPLRQVSTVEPAQRWDLEQLFGPDKQVSWEWPVPSGLQWLPGGEAYVREYDGRYWRVEAATGAMYPFYDPQAAAAALAKLPEISPETARRLAGRLGTLSPQADAQLIVHRGDLYYCRLDRSLARRLTHTPEPERLATFSPNGELVAFVRQHNLHVVSIKDGRSWPLTSEGDENHYFGELDWVYQEEVYGRGNFRGYWWSPDSQRIALLVLDETPVHRYSIVDHLPYRQGIETTPYPKAGDPLPVVRVAVAEAGGGSLTWVELDDYPEEDRLVVRASWHPSSRRLYLQVQDRRQTWLDLLEVDPASGKARRLFRETSPAWIEPLTEPVWLADDAFLWLSPRTGFVHLYLGTTAPNNKVETEAGDGQAPSVTGTVRWTALTRGPWEVRSLVGPDPAKRWVYFTATDSERLEEHLYRVPIAGGDAERITEAGSSHSVDFNSPRTYFFDTASSLTVPRSMTVRRADGQATHVLAPPWTDTVKYYRTAEPKRITYTTRDGLQLDGWLIVPVDFDKERQPRYPVLCYVYGGPQAPVVRNRWGATTFLWHQMLAQNGVCVWMSDNRAATYRGLKYTWTVHRRLGEQELSDLEDSLDWLASRGWIDPQRIGMWGWSYGGYFTAYAMTHSKRFRLGISGAPVTDWRNYDAIYTERLMDLPQQNPDGYRAGSVVAAAAQLHGYLLLIHGDADDNVHMANTLQLAEALQKAHKRFGLMIYPRNRHGITNPEQRRHLWQLMTDTVLEHLLNP